MTTISGSAPSAPPARPTPLRVLDAQKAAVLAGISRGWIETRLTFTGAALYTIWFFPVMCVVGLLFLSRLTVPGTHNSPATGMLPLMLCMMIIAGGLMGPAGGMTADREDGTLLRAKATPNGMLGYLVGKIVMCALTALLQFLVVLLPGVLIVNDLILDVWTWLQIAAVFVGGMVAVVPVGVALGAILKPSQIPLLLIVALLLTGLSFFPFANMPAWLQSLVQVVPAYWVGLGLRSALLPVNSVAGELGDSWRVVEMFAVPAMWAGVGLFLAPILLRRMARRQSGSALARAREIRER